MNTPLLSSYHGMRIGLLGGSFNPAHEGHLAISLIALRRLALDQIWWLVSPQNPLKETSGMAPFKERLHKTKQWVQHPAIHVSDIEQRLGTQYTADTIRVLINSNNSIRFVWLMGADNFLQLPQWKNWQGLMASVPVAILARPDHHIKAGLCHAAQHFHKARIPQEDAALLATAPPPAWSLIYDRLYPHSSTAIRGDKSH